MSFKPKNKHLLFIGFFLFFLFNLIFLLYLNTTLEEGAYLYAAKLVYKGKIPYRDFQYGQSPLWPYFYGFFLKIFGSWPQKLFGSLIYFGRFISLFFSLLTLLFSLQLAKNLAGRKGELVCLFLIVSNLLTLKYFIHCYTYTLTALFFIASLYVWTTKLKDIWKISLSVILMNLGVGIRIILLPSLCLLLLFIFFKYWSEKIKIIFALLVNVLSGLIFFGPFFFADSQAFLFHLFISQLERSHSMLYYRQTPDLVWLHRRLSEFYVDFSQYLPLIIFVLITAWWLIIKKENKLKEKYFIVFLLGITFIQFLVNFIPKPGYVHYHTFLTPLMAVISSWGLTKIFDSFQEKKAQIVLLSTGIFIVVGYFSVNASFTFRELFSQGLLWDKIKETATLIRNYTQPEDEILTFSVIPALESDRTLPINLARGIYTYHPQDSLEKCRRFHLLATSDLLNYINSEKAQMVILTDRYFYGYHLNPIPETRKKIKETIKNHYRLIKEIPQFAGWSGKAYIYIKKQF